MDRIDMSEYFAGSAPSHDATAGAEELSSDKPRPRVNFTYNGFFGFLISDWVLSLLPKKTPSIR